MKETPWTGRHFNNIRRLCSHSNITGESGYNMKVTAYLYLILRHKNVRALQHSLRILQMRRTLLIGNLYRIYLHLYLQYVQNTLKVNYTGKQVDTCMGIFTGAREGKMPFQYFFYLRIVFFCS